MRQVDVQSRKERPRTLIVAGLPSTDAVASIETMHTSHRPRAGLDDGPISVHAYRPQVMRVIFRNLLLSEETRSSCKFPRWLAARSSKKSYTGEAEPPFLSPPS